MRGKQAFHVEPSRFASLSGGLIAPVSLMHLQTNVFFGKCDKNRRKNIVAEKPHVWHRYTTSKSYMLKDDVRDHMCRDV